MKVNVQQQSEIEIKGALNLLLFFILCRNTALGKIAIIKDVISNSVWGVAFLKLFDILSYWWLVTGIVVIYEILIVVLGIWLIKKGVNRREGTFSNMFNNPHLMKVLEKLKINPDVQ